MFIIKCENLRSWFKFKHTLLVMGKFCKKCGKIMKTPKISHCSDECLLADIKNSTSLVKDSKGIELWKEKTNPWK